MIIDRLWCIFLTAIFMALNTKTINSVSLNEVHNWVFVATSVYKYC